MKKYNCVIKQGTWASGYKDIEIWTHKTMRGSKDLIEMIITDGFNSESIIIDIPEKRKKVFQIKVSDQVLVSKENQIVMRVKSIK